MRPDMTSILTTERASVAELALRASERYGQADSSDGAERRTGQLRRARHRGARDRRRPGRPRHRARRSRRDPVRDARRSGRSPTSGVLAPGATVVPIYHTNSPEECEYVLAHSEARACFCEDAEQLAKIEQVRAGLPGARARRRLMTTAARHDHARRAARARRRAEPSDARRARSRASAPRTWRRSSTRPARPARRRAACSPTRNLLATVECTSERLELGGERRDLPVPAARALARADRADGRARRRRHAGVLER